MARALPVPAPLGPALVGGVLLVALGGAVLLVAARRREGLAPVPAPPAPEAAAPAPAPDALVQHQVGGAAVFVRGRLLTFESGFTIDADGDPRAYHPGDWGPRRADRTLLGLDAPENAASREGRSAARPSPGNWPGVVATGPEGGQMPLVQSGQAPAQPHAGFWISKTALQDARYPAQDVRRYVASSEVPYLAVPPELLKLGVSLGDLARVTYEGRSAYALVADVGPAGRLGEGSILLAQRLGIPSSARSGGARGGVRYEVVLGSGRKQPLDAAAVDQQGAALFAGDLR